jgi:hypothetical protein
MATFTLLNKAPTEDGYCYDVTYILVDNGLVNIQRNSGTVNPKDQNYFSSKKNTDTATVRDLFNAIRALQNSDEK